MNYSIKNMSIAQSPTLAIDSKFKEMKANGVDVVGVAVDCFGKSVVDVISCVLDRDDTAFLFARHDRDAFTRKAAERKQKRIHFVIFRRNAFYCIFNAF